MWQADVQTVWRQIDDGYGVALIDLLGAGDSCEDITGQPVESIVVGAPVVWRVRCSPETLAAIEDDPEHEALATQELA